MTFPIKQDHSNLRHCLARVRRKTKVVPKCQTMSDLSLRLLHHLQEPGNYAAYAENSELSSVRTLLPLKSHRDELDPCRIAEHCPGLLYTRQ